MTSIQVLPNPSASARKKDHLEAGKRRLEEFRRKKAQGKPTKAVPTSQLPATSVDTVPVESVDNVPVSDGDNVSVVEPTTLMIDHQTSSDVSSTLKSPELGFSNRTLSGAVDITDDYEYHVQNDVNDVKSDSHESFGISESSNGYDNTWVEKGNESKAVVSDIVATSLQNALNSFQETPTVDNQLRPSDALFGVESYSDGYKSADKYSKPVSSYIGSTVTNLAGNPENGFRQHSMGIINEPTTQTHFDGNAGIMESSNHISFNTRGRRISDSINRHLNIENADWSMPINSSVDHTSSTKSSYSQNSFLTTILGNNSGRSRPSFLDSIDTPQVSSVSRLQSAVKANEAVLPNNELTNGDIPSVSSPKSPPVKLNPTESSGFLYNNNDTTSKQDNFASLEQHIEDLTQEKFSLKRALDTSKSLADSLAFDNSSLTDSFNQQGKVISQLKSDMLQLQEEIQNQLMAFTTLKAEYANAQLECNAADERAKILASEVIGLEEKALRLRSNELKLERQLEGSSAEIRSGRRKLLSLEKECTDFRSTIEALQEEKKLLQSKIRMAALNENVIARNDGGHGKKDAFTITEDLDDDMGMDLAETSSLRNSSEEAGSSSFTTLSEDTFSSLRHNNGNYLSDATATIPNDQMKMVYNINSLISELALEKEELLRALAVESSNTSKLKDLNKELSRNLESQTQRLELLASQKMVSENVHIRPVDTRNTQDAAEYTDEGDEVVERVIGWIMKLFPGGPSKRRISKLV